MREFNTLARRTDRFFDLVEKVAVRLFLLLEVVKHLFFKR
jgi:hypothetical protein